MERRSPAQEVGRERDSAASSGASQLRRDHPRAVPVWLCPRPLRGVREPRCPLGAELSPSPPRWSHRRGRSEDVASREHPGGDSSSERADCWARLRLNRPRRPFLRQFQEETPETSPPPKERKSFPSFRMKQIVLALRDGGEQIIPLPRGARSSPGSSGRSASASQAVR